MKKNIIPTRNQNGRSRAKNQLRRLANQQRLTIGLDLGDRTSRYCILDEAGEISVSFRVEWRINRGSRIVLGDELD